MRALLLVCVALLGMTSCQSPLDSCDLENTGETFGSYDLSIVEPPPQLRKKVEYFNSCSEIVKSSIKAMDLRERYQIIDYSGLSADQCFGSSLNPGDPENMDGEGGAPANINQPTNTQEKYVDEADRVKVSRRYIFYARDNSVEVLDRDSKAKVISIPVIGHWRPYIYVYNEILVVIRPSEKPFVSHQSKNNQLTNSSQPVYIRQPEKFDLIFYDVENMVSKVGIQTVIGHYLDSRMSAEGLLTVVTHMNLGEGSDRRSRIEQMRSVLSQIDCTQVARPAVTDLDHSLTSVNSFNVADVKSVPSKQQTHMMGRFDTVYQNKDLFLTKSYIDWFWWDTGRNLQFSDVAVLDENVVTRLERKANKWNIHSRFNFRGRILGPWSFKEKEDYLFIALARFPENSAFSDNKLEVFRKDRAKTLKVGGLSGIAPGENLQSVRFTDDYVYLVTFLFEDPLFVVDLHLPEFPSIVSELKMPGFSSYLHNTDDGRLIGVGYQDWNLQLSLFDVSNPIKPMIMEQKIVEGWSSSKAQRNHHSFFFDDNWQLMALPVQITPDDGNWWETLSFTGAYFYSLDGNEFVQTGAASHKDWILRYCDPYTDMNMNQAWVGVPGEKDISRVHRIGDELMTFSDFGVRVHDPSNPSQELKRTLFKNPEDSCPRPEFFCKHIK